MELALYLTLSAQLACKACFDAKSTKNAAPVSEKRSVSSPTVMTYVYTAGLTRWRRASATFEASVHDEAAALSPGLGGGGASAGDGAQEGS